MSPKPNGPLGRAQDDASRRMFERLECEIDGAPEEVGWRRAGEALERRRFWGIASGCALVGALAAAAVLWATGLVGPSGHDEAARPVGPPAWSRVAEELRVARHRVEERGRQALKTAELVREVYPVAALLSGGNEAAEAAKECARAQRAAGPSPQGSTYLGELLLHPRPDVAACAAMCLMVTHPEWERDPDLRSRIERAREADPRTGEKQ